MSCYDGRGSLVPCRDFSFGLDECFSRAWFGLQLTVHSSLRTCCELCCGPLLLVRVSTSLSSSAVQWLGSTIRSYVYFYFLYSELLNFNNRYQKDSETVAQLVADVRRLSDHCAYGDSLRCDSQPFRTETVG